MRTLIDAAGVKLELSEHESGNYLLRFHLKTTTGRSILSNHRCIAWQVCCRVITLQQLFDATPSLFIEVVDHTGTPAAEARC